MRIRLLCILAATVSHSASAQFNVPAARLTQTLRIDGASEDLTQVGWVFIAPDGRIGITQPQDRRALLYSADGKRLATFGRRGNGPGEFSGEHSLAIAGWVGDKVWISDTDKRSVSIFSADGRHEVTRSLANIHEPTGLGLPETNGSYTPVALATDGTMIAYRSAASRSRPPTIHVRVTARNEISGIVVQHPIDDASFAFTTPSGRSFYTRVPFSTTYAELMGSDGSRAGYVEARARTGVGSIRVVVLSAAGDTLVSRSESFTPVRVTAAQKDSAVALNRKSWARSSNPVPTSDLDAMDDAMRSKLPDFYSPLGGAVLGIDNTIWIQLGVSPQTMRWVMLSDRAVPEFSVTLPPRARIMQASRTTVWTVEFDNDDLPSVVRYRVNR